MHVASTTPFEGPAPPYQEFRDHIESRLHLVPRFRQKLRFVPFGQGPADLGGRSPSEPRLPRPAHLTARAGSRAAAPRAGRPNLLAAAGPLEALWERGWSGRASRGGAAIIGKTHHCMVDGVSGVDITTVLLGAEREPADPPEEPERWLPEPEPSDAQALSDALLERTLNPPRSREHQAGHTLGPRRALRKATGCPLLSTLWPGIAPCRAHSTRVRPHRPSPGSRLACGSEAVKNESRRDRYQRSWGCGCGPSQRLGATPPWA